MHDKGSKLSYSQIIYITEYIIVIQYIDTWVKTSRKQMDHLFHFETWNYSVSFALRCYHSLYHSMSFVVAHCHLSYHLLSLVVSRWITRLSLYKRSNWKQSLKEWVTGTALWKKQTLYMEEWMASSDLIKKSTFERIDGRYCSFTKKWNTNLKHGLKN